MKISQIFGPTIQGEGSATGRHCLFIRTYNCNLHCAWCDTAYTWADTPEKAQHTWTGKVYDRDDPHLGLKEMDADQVLEKLHGLWNYMENPTTIVVSGGEPMMQQDDLTDVVKSLRMWKNEIHVETAGTISPKHTFDYYVTQYNVSPKLEHSGNRKEMRYKPHVLRTFVDSGKASFKFVVTDTSTDDDFKEIRNIAEECRIPATRIMVMPEGISSHRTIAVARRIVDKALEYGYGLTLRNHLLLWGANPDK